MTGRCYEGRPNEATARELLTANTVTCEPPLARVTVVAILAAKSLGVRAHAVARCNSTATSCRSA